MADISIVASAVHSAPLDYTLPGSQEILLKAVGCTVTGTNAAGDFVPALQLLDPGGHVMWTAVNESRPIAAGRSAIVSWFPGGGIDDAGATVSSASGAISDITSSGASLTVTSPNGPTTNLDVASTGVAAGSYGDSSNVATFTVGPDGRLSAASSTSITGGGAVVNADGWVPDTGTYTYASASSFTVGAVDLTAVYSKGTRIKLTQTTVKYFVVSSSTFGGGTTTVNITAGTDYTLANAAITSPFYSYVDNPQGWPTAFNFTPANIVGWSASPTVSRATFMTFGGHCFIDVRITGTSNATNATFDSELAGATTADGNGQLVALAAGTDNGTTLTSPSRAIIASASKTVTVGKDIAGAAWTNVGTKTVGAEGWYRF